MYNNMVIPDLVNIHLDGKNQKELFQNVGEDLYRKNYVTEGYLEGIIDREAKYPTGLATQSLNIALPHSDPEYIKEPFIYIARNNRPIQMLQMGDNTELKCNYFFFLGIKEPNKQVGLLSKLMELFMDENFIKSLKSIDDEKDMYELIKTNI